MASLRTRTTAVTIIAVLLILILTICPATADVPFFDETDTYDFFGTVIVASDDNHLPLPGEAYKIPDTEGIVHLYRTDIATSSAFPWNGYSSDGWEHGQTTTHSGSAGCRIITDIWTDDPDYWYFHLDPPEGFISVSAHSLNAYGRALDSQTIFYDTGNLPVGDYTFLFQVKRDPRCLEPGFITDICYSGGLPRNVNFYATYSNNTCTGVPIVDYAWKTYDWDFGDGETGQGRDVNHAYKEAKQYRVTLTTTAENGVRKKASRYITIDSNNLKPVTSGNPLTPEFTVYVPLQSPVPPQDVVFDAAASTSGSDPISTYSWDFGDSTTGQGRKVTHTYNASGEYEVTLTIRCANGPGNFTTRNVVIESRTLSVQGPGQADLSAGAANSKPVGQPGAGGIPFLDMIASVPATILSVFPVSSSPQQETRVSGQRGGTGTPGSMQVVVFRESTARPDETIGAVATAGPGIASGNAINPAAITSTIPAPQAIVEMHMIETPTPVASPTLPPVVVMSIPATAGIASQPEIVSPVNRPCPAGYTKCSGICCDLMSETSHCGSCNTTCPPGSACVSGTCTPQCSTGTTACSGACTNLLTDARNCGSCGHACLSGAACTNGQCVAQMATPQQTRPGGIGMRGF
jgi:PKD repeat protein